MIYNIIRIVAAFYLWNVFKNGKMARQRKGKAYFLYFT